MLKYIAMLLSVASFGRTLSAQDFVTLPQPKGVALCIGVGDVDRRYYPNSSMKALPECEEDAKAIASALKAAKLEVLPLLLTKDAKRESVYSAIDEQAKRLTDGDLFVLYYSGHGSQLPDDDRLTPGEDDEDKRDGKDETWCLYDGQLRDDTIYRLLRSFEDGVRVVLISDSCHSTTVAKFVQEWLNESIVIPSQKESRIQRHEIQMLLESRTEQILKYEKEVAQSDAKEALSAHADSILSKNIRERWNAFKRKVRGNRASDEPYAKEIPEDIRELAYEANKSVYDADPLENRPAEKDDKRNRTGRVAICTFGACSDESVAFAAAPGESHSAFTGVFLSVWNDGSFEGNYIDLSEKVHEGVFARGRGQSPTQRGFGAVWNDFYYQKPFTIARPASDPIAP